MRCPSAATARSESPDGLDSEASAAALERLPGPAGARSAPTARRRFRTLPTPVGRAVISHIRSFRAWPRLGTAVVALGLVAWPARPLPVALAGIVLLGVAAALAYSPVVSLAAVAAPEVADAAALGLIGLVATPGVIVGAPLVGALLTVSGDFTAPWLALAVLPAVTRVACAPLARRGYSRS